MVSDLEFKKIYLMIMLKWVLILKLHSKDMKRVIIICFCIIVLKSVKIKMKL